MSAPKLRFKEFDGDWEVNTIQHFMDNNFILDQMDGNHGELYPKSEEFSSSGIPYVSATDFSSGTVDFYKCKRIPLERAKLFKKGIAKNGDVLFAHNATVGPVAILETELDFVVLSTTATYYRCDGNFLNNYYLKNYFESDFFVQQYFGIMSQSTRNQVPITTQRKLSISIPTVKEQTKIASFLSAVDEKISQLTQKHSLLSQYKQGMMQKLFSQQIRFKADDGSDFGDWEDKPLVEITSKASGKNKDGSVSEVLTNSAIKGIIKQSDYFDREIVTEANLNGYYIVNVDDFVYNPRISVHAPVGPIKRNKKCLGVMSPLYTVFKITQGNLTYLEYFFDSNFWHDYVKSVANSGARHDRMNITNKDFFDMPILYPCLEEQTKIANFLSAIDQKIEVVAQQIEQAKQWKKGVLQQMFV